MEKLRRNQLELRSEEINKSVAQKLLAEAKIFDEEEDLHTQTVTLGLANLFLSFNLYRHAIHAFEQISSHSSSEYPLAQSHLAGHYFSQRFTSENAEVQSLDDNPSETLMAIERSFTAASHARDSMQMCIYANVLCGFEDEVFIVDDFMSSNVDQVSTCLFKSCNKIREQQEEIRLLKARLESISINSSSSSSSSSTTSHAAPIVHAFESNHPSDMHNCVMTPRPNPYFRHAP